jgi:hypothetical protein
LVLKESGINKFKNFGSPDFFRLKQYHFLWGYILMFLLQFVYQAKNSNASSKLVEILLLTLAADYDLKL